MRMTMTTGNPARKYDIADHLFFKLQGPTPAALAEAVDVVERVVERHGGDKFWPAQSEEEAEAVWTDRKNAHYSGLAYVGEGAKAWSTDVWCARPGSRKDPLTDISFFPLRRGVGSVASRSLSSRNSYMKLSRTSSVLK